MNSEEKGILVEQQIHVGKSKSRKVYEEYILWAIRYLYMILGSAGIALSITDTFDIEVNHFLLFLGAAVISVFFMVIWRLKIRRLFINVGLLIFTIVIFAIFSSILLKGAANYYNIFAEHANEYYNTKLVLAAVENVSEGKMLFTILFAVFISDIFLSMGIIKNLDGRIVTAVFMIPVFTALSVGLLPDMVPMLIMIIVIVGTFAFQYTRSRESFSARTVTVSMGNGLLSRLRWQTAAVIAVLLLIIIPAGYLKIGPAISAGYESQESLREDIRNGNAGKALNNFWKKVIRGEWDWFPFDIIRSSGVHGGKLSNVKEVRDYDETHLYIDISSNLKAPLYIRGYVGSNYTGKGWKELSSEQIEQGLASGEDVISLSSRYYKLLDELHNSDSSVVKRDLVITNVNANSAFSYIPYGTALDTFTAGKDFDAYTKEDADRTVFSMFYLNTQKTENIEKIENAGKSDTSDEAYRIYAQEVYTQLPEEGLEQFYSENYGKTFNSAAECVEYVRSYLEQHAEYTKKAGSTPHGKDYVEYFLYENHKGVCTHFATAAVLMFRLYGIPARYVEGYMTEELSADNGVQEIKDARAHAWPEIYIPGAGWIPVEVTPGFITDEDLGNKPPESDMDQNDLEDTTDPQQEETASETEEESTIAAVYPEQPTKENSPQQEQPTPQQNEQQNNPQQDESSDNNIFKIIIIVIAVILLMAAVILLIILQRKKRLKIQAARLNAEPGKAIIYAFSRLDSVFEQKGLPEVSEIADVSQLSEFPEIDEETLFWMQNLLQEISFSNHQFTKEAADQAALIYTAAASRLYESSGFIKRLFYKYIKCYL